jgi:uncharacterized protein
MSPFKPALALLASCAIGSCLAADASPAAAMQPSPSHMAAAVDMVRTLHMEQHLQTMVEGIAPAGVRREIMQRIVMQRVDVRAIESMIARVYAENFTEAEIRQLLAFYQSDIGRKLQSKQAALTSAVTQALTGSQEILSNLVVSACAAGFVAAAAEQSEKFQLSLGKQPPTIDEVFRNSGPMIEKAEGSCTCVFGKAFAVAKSRDPRQMFADPAVKQVIEEAFKSGACPRPL